jgi:serine/threonine protein kinase/tetratricopeptide (TPR) repeat protein
MGTVYRAVTTADSPAGFPGTVVAVKVFHPDLVADEKAFARFRLEAEIGKEIRHDHLVRTFGLGSADADGQTQHFMVMDLIEGRTLQNLCEELGTFPEPLLHQVSDQILDALAAIHEHGVVHRDIKPDNIVITPDHRVLLMDLGVARRDDGPERTQTGEFLGSMSYAPPEQFTGVDVGPRADIYAFGVTLFELATGVNPYGDADVASVMRQKLQEEIEPPRTVAPDLDAFWNEVIHTCVRREQSERFASAAELREILAEGEESDWWKRKTSGREVASSDRALKRLRLDRRTRLFGRDAEFEQLRALGARAREEGAALLLHGPSGVGKSRLLYDYLESVAGAGGPAVAAGRAIGTGGAAYGAYVEGLSDLLGDDIEEKLTEFLPDTPALVAPFADFVRGKLQPGPDTGLSKDALLAVSVKVVRALAARHPLVLVLEDLHLAGAETVELFAHLARAVAGHPVFLVGVYASDEVEEDAPLTTIEAEQLGLEPLGAANAEQLVRFIVHNEKAVRALAPLLREKSEGKPLIMLEVLAHLEKTGQLKESDGELEFAGDIDEIAVPSTVSDLVNLRLAALDEDDRETLEAASVLGLEFDASLLAEVLDESPIEISQRLAGLDRKERLIAGTGKDSFRFRSRPLFEATYEAIPEGLRAEYHDLVAETLLEDDDEPEGERAYTVLRHLYVAERASESAPFLESALDYMAGHFHASFAAPFLEKLAAEFEDGDAAKRLALAMNLWAFYELLASRADQLRVLELAGELAEDLGDTGERARIHALRAASYWYTGDFDTAEREAEAGLELAREAEAPKWEGSCYYTLGVVDFRRGNLESCAARCRKSLEIRREIGDRRGEASALQALSLIMPSIGEGERVFETMQEALAIWREIGERRGEGAMLMNIGNYLVDNARYDEGLDHLRQAIETHRETGAALNEAYARTNLGRALDILGRIDDARDSWERALQLFLELGDPNGEVAVRFMMGGALWVYGELELARQQLETAIELAGKSGAKRRLAAAHGALGALSGHEGRLAEAWEHLDKAIELEQELNDPPSRMLTLGTAASVALDSGDHERAIKLLEEALADAQDGEAAETPLILCRLARAHRGAGRTDEAREFGQKALALVESDGSVSAYNEPEVYFTLFLSLGDQRFLARARELVEQRGAQVRSGALREYFLERTWPNSAILAMGPAEAGP